MKNFGINSSYVKRFTTTTNPNLLDYSNNSNMF